MRPRNERHGAGRLLSDFDSSDASTTHLGDFDVVVAGGTLGLMLATALQGGRSPSSSVSSASPSPTPSSSPLRVAVGKEERSVAVPRGRRREEESIAISESRREEKKK